MVVGVFLYISFGFFCLLEGLKGWRVDFGIFFIEDDFG